METRTRTYPYVSITVRKDVYAPNVGSKTEGPIISLLEYRREKKMESYDSADFDPLDMKPGLKASELTDKGIEFVYKGMREDEGKFGTFYALQIVVDGEEQEILFSSKRLAALFTKHGEAFMDKELNLSGYDEGVNRKYKVSVIQTTL